MSIRSIRRKRLEIAMFVLYMLLFLGGFYLFGVAFTADAWQSVIFTAGILAVSLAVALPFHTRKS